MKTAVTLLMLFALFSLSSFAQDYTQWGLPEGAKTRLGKGHITGNIAYSPDGTRLAMASSIGIWIYDTHTGERAYGRCLRRFVQSRQFYPRPWKCGRPGVAVGIQ